MSKGREGQVSGVTPLLYSRGVGAPKGKEGTAEVTPHPARPG